MAETPPPMDFEDDQPKGGSGEEGADLFAPPEPPEQQQKAKEEEPQEQEPPAAEMFAEVPMEPPPEPSPEPSPEPEPEPSPEPSPEPEPEPSPEPEPEPFRKPEPEYTPPEPTPDIEPPTLEPSALEPPTMEPPTLEVPTLEVPTLEPPAFQPPSEPAKTLELFEDDQLSPDLEGQGDEEERDSFELTIQVMNPEKVGDGMGAYMVYNICTTTTIPAFRSSECTVRRRFSDFLSLNLRLNEKYLNKGRIVPPAPEKSMMGMTVVKFSKNEETSAAFVERRRASLERYLMRLANHPVLRKDDIFRDFLENVADLPKAKDTAAMSGAGFMRLMKNVGESFSKMATKKTETDSWFDEQQQNYEVLDGHLKKLHQAIEAMIASRKELCSNTNTFVKSMATLGNVEENNSVSRALSKLSEVQERVEALHQEQVHSDLFIFGETIKDYTALLGAIKVSFGARAKNFNVWQSAQATLDKKRESEQKLQVGGKPEKLAQVQQEIREWESKVEEGRKNFEAASETLRQEVKRFEADRAAEFKSKFITYMEAMMRMQQELIRLWEGYLPDAQAIA